MSQSLNSMNDAGIRASLQEWASLDRYADKLKAGASSMWQHTREVQEDAWARDVKCAEGAGLVSVPTSSSGEKPHCADYPHPSTFKEVDQRKARLARLRLNVGFSGHLHTMETSPKGSRPWQAWMLTLTYARCGEWSPKHVSEAMKHVRRWAARRGVERLRYVWVAELQKRGAVHYHVVVWLPRELAFPKPDKQGWWAHGMTNVVRARKPVSYLCKYLSKGGGIDEQRLPDRARCYGIGGLDRNGRDMRGWHRLPTFLRGVSAASERGDYSRADGGGWLSRITGEWWPSEFKAVFSRDSHGRGRLCVARLHAHQVDGALSDVCGPWSRLPASGASAGAPHLIH